jgi:hypothetical protein
MGDSALLNGQTSPPKRPPSASNRKISVYFTFADYSIKVMTSPNKETRQIWRVLTNNDVNTTFISALF